MKKINFLTLAIIGFFAVSLNAKSIDKTNQIAKNNIVLADSVNLADYVGKFKLAEGSPVEAVIFVIVDGKLTAKAGEYPDAALNVKVVDKFEDSGMGAIFTFTRTDGKVDKLKIEVQGMELLATKVVE